MRFQSDIASCRGFTLIELVVTILILGIITATVAPKFFDAKGSEEIAIQNQVVSVLRTIQLRRMQQTDQRDCFDIRVTSKKLTLLATDSGNPPDCDISSDAGHPTTVEIEDNSPVTFQVGLGGYTFTFDNMGRPSSGCGAPCEIVILGQSTRKVQINTQGFIESVEN